MKLLIHDLTKEELQYLIKSKEDDIEIVSSDENTLKCIGCFGCWFKTPGKCILKDTYNNMGELLAKSEDIIVISKCYFGSYSPKVKRILDRVTGYVHPLFESRNGETHHRSRYDRKLRVKFYFYSEVITKDEEETAKALGKATGVNWNSISTDIITCRSITEIGGVF